ncbi:MAG: NAD-dependent epimerase/dehydratase family protein, partial [Spirochaetia bacterium]|nr:NAD-dependent epimerase/dehydratase family protein [Spirochaetia bacterium]
IGYPTSLALQEAGYSLRLLVRNKNPVFPETAEIAEKKTFSQEVFSEALEGMDAAFYSLGLPEQWLADPGKFKTTNFDLLKIFLDSWVKSGVRKLIFVSTYEVFAPIVEKIREDHPLFLHHASTYFKVMTLAYLMVKEFTQKHGLKLITIHPAAVYGGPNTGRGATDFLLNAKNRNILKLPALFKTSFPVVHVDSLARGIIKAIEKDRWGESYLFSDQMTSLEEMAKTLKALEPRSWIPPRLPVWFVRVLAFILELLSKWVTHRPPLTAKVQIDFLTKGMTPITEKAVRDLDWKPMPLQEGLQRFLKSNFLRER